MPVEDEAVEAARRDVSERYLAQSGVNAVAIGHKVVGGQSRGELAVRVFVSRKRPESYLPARAILPKSVRARGRSIPVDVVQAGPFYPLALLSLADQTRSARVVGAVDGEFAVRYRPVPFGVSVGHHAITAGTVGCVVTDNTDGSLQVLSNNHVLADVNAGAPGDEILQPGAADGGESPADVVAHLKRFVPLSWTAINHVDAAIATPVDPNLFVNAGAGGTIPALDTQHPAVGLLFAGDCAGNILGCRASSIASALEVSFPGGHAEPVCEMIVEKAGRTTGWTVNRITDISAESKILFHDQVAEFEQLFLVPAFGHAGDSGSVIVRGQA